MPEVDQFQKLGERLVHERAHRYKVFDDANPDVGMGPTWDMHVSDALKSLIKEGLLPPDFKMSETAMPKAGKW